MRGIVVGYDGSHNAEFAVKWAMQRATAEHLVLTVLTVNEVAVSPWTGEPSVVSADNVMMEKARQAAEEAVVKVSREIAASPKVTVTATTGLVGEELVNASQHADMLVIGSRGQRGFPGLRVSEIAMKIAHYSSCPIVIVPPAE